MNEIPPPNEEADDVDERYRRLSDRDPSGPSGAVRRAVLRHAAELASAVDRPAATRARWRVASYGGLAAAAALAGLLVAPHFLTPLHPPMARQSHGSPAPAPAAPPAAGEAADAQRATEMPEAARDSVARRRSSTLQTPPVASSAGAASARALSLPRAQDTADRTAALREAARRGDETELRRLLGEKVNIDARDARGRTALMLAVRSGQKEAVTTLLAAGADPNAADTSGATPLQVALADAHSAIAAALEQWGAR
jgi:hypothetical protein